MPPSFVAPQPLRSVPRPLILPSHRPQKLVPKAVAQQPRPAITRPSKNPSEAAVYHAEHLLRASYATRPSAAEARLGQLSRDERATAFAMRYIDRVERVRGAAGAARQLLKAVEDGKDGTAFLSSVDKTLMRVGVGVLGIAPWMAPVVMAGAKMRMRDVVGKLVLVDGKGLEEGVEGLQKKGYGVNVNLLGELVLGNEEAEARLGKAIEMMGNDGIDYVSVKVSGITARLNYWDFDGSLKRIETNLVRIFRASKQNNTFVNVDMEAYEDLSLSYTAFMSVLGRDEFAGLDAGIVLQAYLPDALGILQRLVAWSNERYARGGGKVKIRIVKGANLAQEKVDAELRGWEQTPYATKVETDANWLRCMDYMIDSDYPERTESVIVGVASHNMFSVSYVHLRAAENELLDRVQFEMISGMVPAQSAVLRDSIPSGMLLYTPVCEEQNFVHAVSYLFRRLEENGSGDNYLRSLMSTDKMLPGSRAFDVEETRFKAAVALKDSPDGLATGPRRSQERPALEAFGASRARDALSSANPAVDFFVSEPDTDPAIAGNRAWSKSLYYPSQFSPAHTEITATVEGVQAVLETGAKMATEWSKVEPKVRAEALLSIGNEIAKRRGDLINALIVEGSKLFAEADVEVSEAVDFALYYAERALHLPSTFKPLGTMVVVSPWNYPCAIPAGGVLSSLAAGNSAILKPAPETVRCGEILAECIAAANLPEGAFQFVRVPENDCGRHLLTKADGVILTGASETASLFRSWKPDMKLFAETSGKNSMVITPSADMDLAVSDLVESAFGHAGQKCSASSLCILVGDMRTDESFFRQLKDAVQSLEVGSASDEVSEMPPLIAAPPSNLKRALTTLDEGEEWLVEPRCLDGDGEGRTWTPGVKLWAGEWYRSTECFGGVLGIVAAADMDEALRIQNAVDFGLTAGLQSLDTNEIEYWSDRVEAGNLYINRGTSGAIVRRQPFGGIKKSSCGPGAMAGGPNYTQQLGMHTQSCVGEEAEWLAKAKTSDAEEWASFFSKEIDWAGMSAEANVHRYRPARVAIRVGTDARSHEIERVEAAIRTCQLRESDVIWSYASAESGLDFAKRLPSLGIARVRTIGQVDEEIWSVASVNNVYVANNDVVWDGRVELLNYLQEQCISRTRHRFGNLLLEKVAEHST